MTYVLGLSFDYHDAAAALLRDGEVVAAASEERFTRQKNDPSLPVRAVEFCLRQARITSRDLAAVAYYERPLLKFDRILGASAAELPHSERYFMAALKDWIFHGKLNPRERIARALDVPARRVAYIQHHASHAASAYFCSPFDEAAVVTLDGVGEYETLTISAGRGSTLRQLVAGHLPHSLGLFYSAITAYLGFRVNEDEYKVMGMAGFGRPVLAERFLSLFSLHADGSFALDQRCFSFTCPVGLPYRPALVELLGPPREPESSFRVEAGADSDASQHELAENRRFADIAASAQRCTEEVMLHVVSRAMERVATRNVCMAGGVALNSLANGRIQRELGCRLYVQPAAGDAGGALGAALHHYHVGMGSQRRVPLVSPYLGATFEDAEVEGALKKTFTRRFRRFEDDLALADAVARLLHEGAVVGWCQGRFEWGPRALGNRSILANPTLPDMQRLVNEKIKFREPFRPFAPAVLEGRAEEYFEVSGPSSVSSPEHYMLSVCRVRDTHRDVLPAVTHVDGTARIQLVSQSTNPLFYSLIERFERYSGVPVVLNTSFNLRGEPIVATPENAIRTFEWSDMDFVAIGRWLIEKEAA